MLKTIYIARALRCLWEDGGILFVQAAGGLFLLLQPLDGRYDSASLGSHASNRSNPAIAAMILHLSNVIFHRTKLR
jgi:hypothetical protein